MYMIIAYHGKGKKEVENDLKKLWFNYANFVKLVDVEHIYFFQRANDASGADLLMIIDYKCSKSCFKGSVGTEQCSAPTCGALKQSFASKNGITEHSSALNNRSVNYWLYIRDSINAPNKEA